MDASRLNFARQIDYIPITNFSGFILAEGTPNLLRSAYDSSSNYSDQSEFIVDPGGTPAQSGIVGIKLLAAAKGLFTFFRIPTKWDRKQPIKTRIIWTSNASAVGSRSVTFVSYVSYIIPGTTLMSATPTAATATAQAPTGTDGVVERGNPMTLPAPGDTATYARLGFLTSSLHADLITSGIWVLGMEIEYGLRLGTRRPRTARDWKPSFGAG